MTVYHYTPGDLEIYALTTFGVSVKDEKSIGRFGTGFKYAVAGILRLGGSIVIETPTKSYTFTTEARDVRGRAFQFIELHDGEQSQQLGFTTELGKHWEPWMLMRELHSNTLDEHGDSSTEWRPFDGTTIIVNCREYEEAFSHLDKYFVVSAPIYQCERFALHPEKNSEVFYRGVLIGKTPHNFPYTFNFFKGIDITEDRVARSLFDVRWKLSRALGEVPEKYGLEILSALASDEHFPDYGHCESLVDRAMELGRPVPPLFRSQAMKRSGLSMWQIAHAIN